MKVSDFDYVLPEELIAQTPLKNREASRLLILDKEEGTISHDHFYSIIDNLNKGDVLVLNDTSVIPARLYGEKVDTGALIEILLLKQKEEDIWECLVKKARKIKGLTQEEFGSELNKSQGIVSKYEWIVSKFWSLFSLYHQTMSGGLCGRGANRGL